MERFMPAGVVGHITKGIVHRAVDHWVNSSPANRAEFLAAVKRATAVDDYLTVLKRIGVSDTATAYLRDTWYNTRTGYWPRLQPIYPLLRRGLIKALEVAGDRTPLDSYWLPTAENVFIAVPICQNPWCVIRVIVTPPPTIMSEQPRTVPAPMWTVKKTAGDPLGETEESGDDLDSEVKVWRALEFPDGEVMRYSTTRAQG